ncbi:MAG: metallophosphoesterase family protein [Planctomycetota bacterium]|nr:metallophosphoesterase family protein [Planctomycetota bacterium]
MDGRVIAIGDIHGCVDALRALVESIQPTPEDTLVLLGDYVDRGPHSKQVVDFLIGLRETCKLVCLYGNHEEMMADVVVDGNPPYDWLRYGGVDTLDSYGFVGDLSVVPVSHREFLEELVEFYETDSHFFVHANYDPTLPLDDQPSDLLRWIKLSEIIPEPHRSGKIAIVGHTHHREGEIFQLPHLICLDTYCYGGKWLTAMDVGSGQVWQSDKNGNLREFI